MTEQELTVRADDLTARYISLRDFKEKFSAETAANLAKVKAAMDKIELEMMTFLNASGQESSKTKAGTFFKQTKSTASVADRDLFMAFVLENSATNFLTSAVSAVAVREYVAEHSTLPPGVNMALITSVGVHRPATR